MPRKQPTTFDRFFDQQMEEPRFATAYRKARKEIDTTDAVIRALDEARVLEGMSKAELARKIEASPVILRRLFTAPEANPTMDTVLKVVTALGYHLELVPNAPAGGRRAAPSSASARRKRQP